MIKDQLVRMTGFDADLINIKTFVDCKDTTRLSSLTRNFQRGVMSILELLIAARIDFI